MENSQLSTVKNKDSNYIRVYDNVIEPEQCKSLRTFFENNIKHSYLESTKWRQFREINLSLTPEYDVGIGKILRPYVKIYQQDCKISDYVWPKTYRMEHCRFKKYESNDVDRFDTHADNTTAGTSTRFLVFFIYLSNNKDGRTCFPTYDICVEPKEGRLLMFPPNWCYPHYAEKVTNNPKYILGSYGHYAQELND